MKANRRFPQTEKAERCKSSNISDNSALEPLIPAAVLSGSQN